MSFIWILTWPLASAALLALMGSKRSAAQWLNLVLQIGWAVVFLGFVMKDWTPDENFRVYYSWNWLPTLKSRFSLGLDGLNFPLVALNVFLSLVLAFYSLGKEKLSSAYLALFSLLNAASVGSLLAADALCFYVFWELMLIPMYFLIGRWGSENRVYAALKFFGFTMAGSLPLLVAVAALAQMPSVPSLGWHDLVLMRFPFEGWSSVQGLLFIAFMVAFAVKVPVWPVHSWLPDAHTQAPTGASVILAGVLLKLGVYGIARWCLPLFPQASQAAAPLMITFGCVGIVYGSLAAWKQSDFKRLIAYSSVAHLGFMVIGLFALRPEALQGALFQNIAHGLSTGAMFLIFGIIYDRTHTRKIAEYGGLATATPWLALTFMVAVMASIGLPGLPGFIGEFLVLASTYADRPLAMAVASTGVLLGAIYMLSLSRRAVFGKPSAAVTGHPVQPSWSEWIAVLAMTAVTLYVGWQPQPLLSVAEKAVRAATVGIR